MTVIVNDTETILHLDGEQGVSAAAELRARLLESLTLGKGIVIQLGPEVAIDVTTLQLFYAAQREAARRGLTFTLSEGIPEMAAAVFAQCGAAALTPSGRD